MYVWESFGVSCDKAAEWLAFHQADLADDDLLRIALQTDEALRHIGGSFMTSAVQRRLAHYVTAHGSL